MKEAADSKVIVEGWRFMPFAFVGDSPEAKGLLGDQMESEAKGGKGLFANHFQIPQEDEFLDGLLGVEAYGLKCSFVPFLDDLKRYGIVDGEKPFLSRVMARCLFVALKEAATFLKGHTDKPQAVKNKIASFSNEFGNIPIWGLFMQILFLQGLCRLLEGVNINEGDDGFDEANSLYKWLCLELMGAEIGFTYKPYGEKDRERLRPFCAYLISTDVGQLVQGKLFGKEQQGSRAGNTPQEQQNRPQEATNGSTLAVVPNEPQQAAEGQQMGNNEPQQEKTLRDLLPERLRGADAVAIFQGAIDANMIERTATGFLWQGTKQLLAYFADRMSSKYKLSSKLDKDGNTTIDWKTFERLFGVKGLQMAKQNWMRLNTRFEPTGFEEVDALF